jgi:hypothetical protein
MAHSRTDIVLLAVVEALDPAREDVRADASAADRGAAKGFGRSMPDFCQVWKLAWTKDLLDRTSWGSRMVQSLNL